MQDQAMRVQREKFAGIMPPSVSSPSRHRHEMADYSGNAGMVVAATMGLRGALLVGGGRLTRRPRAGRPDRLELRLLLVSQFAVEVVQRDAHRLDCLQHGVEPTRDSLEPRPRRD